MDYLALLKRYEKEAMDFGYTKEKSKTVSYFNRKYFIYVDNNQIKLFAFPPTRKEAEQGASPSARKYVFPICDILYFSREGEVYTETKLLGGGSTFPNIGGAIAGAIIAGAPGAIIGGQAKQTPIKSETITHDTRKTVLVCKDRKLVFAPEDYSALMQLIPDKELSVVQQRRALEAMQSPTEPSIEERLQKLKQLNSNGLITEEEYQVKRRNILDEI